MTDYTRRPLWKWVLLAIVPSLASVAAAVVSDLTHRFGDARSRGSFDEPMVVIQLLMPLVGLFYLLGLSSTYVKSGRSSNWVGFVLGYGVLNTLIWFAGCSLQWSRLSVH
jgi:putative Mn2+ efflux pump MntP